MDGWLERAARSGGGEVIIPPSARRPHSSTTIPGSTTWITGRSPTAITLFYTALGQPDHSEMGHIHWQTGAATAQDIATETEPAQNSSLPVAQIRRHRTTGQPPS